MKRISFLLLFALALFCSLPALAQRENRSIGENQKEARKAAKQQQKYSRKQAKRQGKAMKKYQKAQRKASKQPKRRTK